MDDLLYVHVNGLVFCKATVIGETSVIGQMCRKGAVIGKNCKVAQNEFALIIPIVPLNHPGVPIYCIFYTFFQQVCFCCY